MSKTFLIYGGRGWIGSMLVTLLEKQGHVVVLGQKRLEDYYGVREELKNVRPDFVLNTAGITGVPNVDWCESHKSETIMANTVGITNLVHACNELDIHVTNYATGCIYKYDASHPIGSGFKETDKPNFRVSAYSNSKVLAEELLSNYNNVLILRLRMPISDDMHPRSLVTKIVKYAKVTDIPNSMTVLSEMLPISIDMTLKKRCGIYNFTNPGVITHPEILAMYKQWVDPTKTWQTFTVEEQNAILLTERSNCELDVSKLLAEYKVYNIHTAVEKILKGK